MEDDQQQLDVDDLLSWLLVNGGDFLPDDNNMRHNFQSDDLNNLNLFDNVEFAQYLDMNDIPQSSSSNQLMKSDSSERLIKNEIKIDTIDGDSDDSEETNSKKRKYSYSKNSDSNKKAYGKLSIEELERKVKDLEEENVDLKMHLSNINQRNTEIQRQRTMMESMMVQLADSNAFNAATQSQLDALLRDYTEIYADYGKSRQKEVR